MANMPDVNKRFISALLTLERIRVLDKEAAKRGMTRTELLEFIIDRQLSGVELTPEDYIWISEQVKINQSKRRAK